MNTTAGAAHPGAPALSVAERAWPEHPVGADLREARLLAGLPPAALRVWTGKHPTTLARMERDEARVCRATYHLLVILGGVCPWPAWRGWSCVGERLYPPEDRTRGFAAHDIRTVGWAWALAVAARGPAPRARGARSQCAAPCSPARDRGGGCGPIC